MPSKVATEIGDNWCVLFFECPTSRIDKVLVDLFQYIRKIKEASIPHFIMREFEITKHFGISLRVLRKQDDADIVSGKLVEFFNRERLGYQENPQGNRHAWIQKGQNNPHWNKNRCEALHRLSNFVVLLASNHVFSANDKCYFAHYTVNMLGLQEATVPNSNQVYYWDIVSGQALPFHTQQLRSA